MKLETFSTRRWVLSGALAAMLFAACSMAGWAVELPSADLPPESDPPDCGALLSHYRGAGSTFTGPDSLFEFDGTSLRCFGGPVQRTAVGDDEQQVFSSTFLTTVTLSAGGVPMGSFPTTLTGPIETLVTDRSLTTTGLFDAEIVSISLSGDAGGTPITLRESPALTSVGQIDVTDIGGGLYSIESYFDVFTELSVDGGNTWIAADAVQRLTLMRIPTVILPSADLPPESDPPDCNALVSHYWGPGSSHVGPDIFFEFDCMSLECFGGPVQRTVVGNDEQQVFSAILLTTVTLTVGGVPMGPFPATLTGPVGTLVTDRILSTIGIFDAEIFSMSLSGDAGGTPITLRESPALTSIGQIRIFDIGGGLYSFGSFFDVFTELSVDGGNTWIAAETAQRLTLLAIDEVPVELRSFTVE